MLRIFTSILFGAFTFLGTFGLSVSFAKSFDNMVTDQIWFGVGISTLMFVMGCIGLFILITTKAHITISKQFVTEKTVETKKSKRK